MPALLLVIAFIVVPLLELAAIIQVGQWIGVIPTIVILLVDSLLGAYLLKREGRAAWRNFRSALDRAKLPTVEVVDGALVIFGGALLLTPGFVTDIVGLLLLFPATRAVANRMIRSRVRGVFGLGSAGQRPAAPAGAQRRGKRQPGGGDVLDVEVVKVERNPPPGS